MTTIQAEQVAVAMYDGGWIKEDKEQFEQEYSFTDFAARLIQRYLAEFEAGEGLYHR